MMMNSRALSRQCLITAACMLGLSVVAAQAQETTGNKPDSSMQQSDSSRPQIQGYRAMDSSAGAVSADSGTQDSSTLGDSSARHAGKAQKADHHKAAASRDSTKWGYKVDSSSKNQNPPGYRGMERPANVLPADSGSGAKADTAAPADATSRINQRARQDSSSVTGQNPPGYRGMERPAGLDTAQAASGRDSISQNNSGDTTRADTAQ
ncbi:MAG TPA: hypothetical protein VFZ90_01810 [Gemmatimonadales bacterium]